MIDLGKVKQLIGDTTALSSVEKAEWLQLLSSMNDGQVLELIKILSPQKTPPPPQQTPPTPLYRIVDYKEKELSTSKPQNELEIAAHPQETAQAPVLKPQPPQPKPQPTVAPTVPIPPLAKPTVQVASTISIQQKEHLITPQNLKQAAMHAQAAAAVEHAKQQPKPASLSSVISTQTNQQPVIQKPLAAKPQQPIIASTEAHFATPEDFSKIAPDFLHSHDTHAVLENLMKSIIEVSKKYKFFIVIANLEQSPLYKTYVNTGLILLNYGAMGTSDIFDNYINNAKLHNQPYMTREEFEKFTDFRRDLDRLVI